VVLRLLLVKRDALSAAANSASEGVHPRTRAATLRYFAPGDTVAHSGPKWRFSETTPNGVRSSRFANGSRSATRLVIYVSLVMCVRGV
jgi:hypothetical protein